MTKTEELVVHLYECRTAKLKAKSDFVAATSRLGECLNREDERAVECHSRFPIYTKEDWCVRCRNRQPFWDAYQAAAYRARGALTSLVIHGKKLSRGLAGTALKR